MKKNIIVALDHRHYDEAMRFAAQLNPEYCRVKVGKSLFVRAGVQALRALHDLGHEVFLDLKFHDIPNTVADAVLAAAEHHVWMVNVHAQGGLRMMEATVAALRTCNHPPLLIAVTVLTSMQASDLQQIGCHEVLPDYVARLTDLAVCAGLDGVVCSAWEAGQIKAKYREFLTVTPGIRTTSAGHHDQMRVMTPREAVQSGSDYLVIGRAITQADDPMAALRHIISELSDGDTPHE